MMNKTTSKSCFSYHRNRLLLGWFCFIVFWIFPPSLAFGFTHHFQNGWKRSPQLFLTEDGNDNGDLRVFVMGKIIVDEYGSPKEISEDNLIDTTVGGGGPQAAWGASAALAVLGRSSEPQAVTFMGPVGSLDWTEREDESLKSTLKNALDVPYVLWKNPECVTPRIRLWHDDQEQIQWFPLNDSFGESGAKGLWSCTPSLNDFEQVISKNQLPYNTNNEKKQHMKYSVIHVIMEAGYDSPSRDWEAEVLLNFLSNASEKDENIFETNHVLLSLEPIVFPDPSSGKIRKEDAEHCFELLQKISVSFSEFSNVQICISPDYPLYQGLCKYGLWENFTSSIHTWAVRNGGEGSELHFSSNGKKMRQKVKAASLQTSDGKPINPTGAGNAFAAAYAASLGSGEHPIDAACVATGVGAVFCEHEHIPPYSDTTIERIKDAARSVREHINNQDLDRHLGMGTI